MIEITRHGRTVRFDDAGVDPANPGHVHQHLYNGDFYEQVFLDYIRSLGKGGVYIDAGALIGTHSLYFAALCNAEQVFSFEPRRRFYDELERNVAANGLGDRLTILRNGLAADTKSVTVRLDNVDETFDCVTLDDVVKGEVTVLKVDVEGMELDVLRGATRILNEWGPVVFAEAHTTEERAAIADYLRPFGYQMTGRVFNASPTYEFVRIETLEEARKELDETATELIDWRLGETKRRQVYVRERERTRILEARNAALEADCEGLRRRANGLEKRLRSARGSITFRVGRATAVAARDALPHPVAFARRWVEVFGGPDDILEDAVKQV